MKYVMLLVLGLILGVVAYHQVQIRPTPIASPRASGSPAPVAAPVLPDAGSATPATVAPPAATPTVTPAEESTAATPLPAPVLPDPRPDGAGLLIPVQGKRAGDLADTFTDARSQGRSHDAIDIMAPAGTPVLAVADGHVEKLFTSERGGLTLYQFEPGGKFAYYYAHLQRYADGLAEQQQVRRGQVIGYVGSTGNASPDAPHLHFAIFALGPERRWWEGTAINPYPLLAGER